jgi:transcriptional antiterminator NusG
VTENPQNSSQQLPDDRGLEVHSNPAAAPGGFPDTAAPAHDDASAPSNQVEHEQAGAPETPQSEPVAREEEAVEAAAPEVEEPERGPIEETPVGDEPPKLDWFILKVQSNREDSIRESLKRRVAVAGLEKYFDEIIVPVEMVSEFKGGKKRVVKRKLYPGYLVVHMEINEDTWFLVRETPGIGDFTGSAGKPTPMLPHEVAKIVSKQEEKTDEAPKLKINFNVGDRVKINEGTFDNFEGEVDSIEEASGRVTVMINIFGRSTPVELEYWQIENI